MDKIKIIIPGMYIMTVITCVNTIIIITFMGIYWYKTGNISDYNLHRILKLEEIFTYLIIAGAITVNIIYLMHVLRSNKKKG